MGIGVKNKINKKNLINIIYIAIFLVISLVPLFTFSGKQAAIGNETEADKPALSDGLKFTANVDSYFAQKFGFRNRLVYAQNFLKETIFKTSGQSDVIVGEDGWLFYGRALDDFLGTSVLDEVSIERMGVILSMMQEYVERQNGEFIFVSAPNKMSVYGEYMPYYYIEENGQGNYELLYDRLTALGVNTVQLKNELALKKLAGVQLYHKLDSHWNNYGAAIAYEAMAEALSDVYGEAYSGYTHYSGLPYSIKNNFSGDLQSMLLPGSKVKDAQVEFDVEESFEYLNRFRGVDDLVITTQNNSAAVDKSATLFRDSFGNALYRFFANEYTSLTAKREIPYNIYQAVSEAELVAVELVERNLKNLLIYTPVIPSWNLADAYSVQGGTVFMDGVTVQTENEGTTAEDTAAEEITAGAADSVAGVESIAAAVVRLNTTADGLIELTGSSDVLRDYAYMYLKIVNEAAGTTAIYQLIPGEEGNFTLYLEPENADISEAGLENYGYAFIVKTGNEYTEIPVSLTLQD